MNKKESNLRPTLNIEQGYENQDITWLYREASIEGEEGPIPIFELCQIGKSVIVAEREKPYEVETMSLYEIRSEMPIMSMTWVIGEGKRDLLQSHVNFPIDEEDESQVKRMLQRIAELTDPEKVPLYEEDEFEDGYDEDADENGEDGPVI
jgi:hypothetical protein